MVWVKSFRSKVRMCVEVTWIKIGIGGLFRCACCPKQGHWIIEFNEHKRYDLNVDSLTSSAVSYQSPYAFFTSPGGVCTCFRTLLHFIGRFSPNDSTRVPWLKFLADEISRIQPAPTSAGRHLRDDENPQRLVAAHSEDAPEDCLPWMGTGCEIFIIFFLDGWLRGRHLLVLRIVLVGCWPMLRV